MAGKNKLLILTIVIAPLLAAILLLFLLEISLRIYQVYDPNFLVVPDTTYLQYRGSPHSSEFNGFKLNSRGFKDIEFSKKKSTGRFRILALGDSQTYGAVPYPDSYMAIVEKKLRLAYPQCELLNMGVPSAGPVDYLSVLLNEGLDLHPDMILLHFNNYDDFKNGGKRLKFYSYSVAASLINRIFVNRFEPQGKVFGRGMYREGFLLRSDESYAQLVLDAHGSIFYKKNVSFTRDFQSSFGFIKKIQKVCDRKKIALVVVIIPADLQLYPDLQKKVMIILHSSEENYDYRIPNRMLHRELQRLRIPYFDILDAYLQKYSSDRKRLTQGNDPHWNIYGSMVAAEAVSPWLKRQVGKYIHLKQNQN